MASCGHNLQAKRSQRQWDSVQATCEENRHARLFLRIGIKVCRVRKEETCGCVEDGTAGTTEREMKGRNGMMI
jgi:hypothetical protein